MRLVFWNVGYAKGVQDFEIEMKVTLRGETFLLCQLLKYDPVRGAVITELSVDWLAKCCSWAMRDEKKLHSVGLQEYLSSVFITS